MQSIYNVDKADFIVNPPRWAGYSIDTEELEITGTDPSIDSSWKSPSQNVISENSLSRLFDYTANPGSVTYVGQFPIVVKCEANVSVDSDLPNNSIRLRWVKNGSPGADGDRYISDKITSASTEGILPSSRTFILENGDYLDFYYGASILSTLSILKSEYNIITIAVLD